MQKNIQQSPFPLRLAESVREEAKQQASKNRRSLNSEIGLLIEEGLKWRQQKGAQIEA